MNDGSQTALLCFQKNDIDKLLMKIKLIGAKVVKKKNPKPTKFVSCMVKYFGDLERALMHEQ